MTTTVRVLIEGNKACEVKVVNADGAELPGQVRTVQPNTFTTLFIHGDQKLTVAEVGDFLTQ